MPTRSPIPQTTILEPWSAKLNAQISNANSAALYYLRSDRLEYGIGAAPERPPETRTNFLIPTDFYKAEDSNVFSSDLFGSVFASYQNPRFTSTPIGGLDRDVQYYDNSFHNTFFYTLAKDPQKQANLQVSKFFNTGRINHELKFSFNYRQQIADTASGLPGSQNWGATTNVSSATRGALPWRAQDLQHAVLDRHPRRHADRGQSHGCRGSSLRPAAGEEQSQHVVCEHDVRESLHGLRCRRGVLPGSAGGEVPRREGLAVAVHELAAPGLGDLRAREGQGHAAPGLVCALRGPARLARLLPERRAVRKRLLYAGPT